MGLLGSVFSIGASLLGGSSAKKASKAAQKAQLTAANNASRTIQDYATQGRQDLLPYQDAGTGALDQLMALLGVAPGSGGQGRIDFEAYARANPDVMAGYQQNLKNDYNTPLQTLSQFGEYHYNNFGKNEGRDISGFTTGGGGVDPAGIQAQAIEALKGTPLYESLYRTGEEAVLSTASATGGLRGGNIQRSLADFGSDTLAKVFQQQLSNLGGLTTLGFNAAGENATLGANTGGNLANLFSQKGDTGAGGILQRSAINSNMFNQVGKELGSIAETVAGGGKLF